MGEKHPSTEKKMWPVSCKFLESFQQRIVYPFGAELDDEFVVIDNGLLSIASDGSLDIPRGNNLILMGSGFGDVRYSWRRGL